MPSSTTVIPDFVSALFWDTDPATVDPVSHRDFILGRILSAGSMDAIRWARVECGDDVIRDWIVRHEGRQLSSQQLRFWQTVIGLPGDAVDAWIATPERRIWEGRGEVSFLEFRPPLLEPLVDLPDVGCRRASMADLAAMKLLAVTQRGTRKDFVDVLAMSRGMSLDRMLDCYRRRFGVTDTARVLAGLCFFDDAETEPMPKMIVSLDWETVKHELRALVRSVAGE